MKKRKKSINKLKSDQITVNIFDYIAFTLIYYSLIIGPIFAVFGLGYFSITTTTIYFLIVLTTIYFENKGESVRRKNLNLPPRKGWTDTLLRKLPFNKILIHLLLIPFLLSFPMTFLLIVISSIMAFIFDETLGLIHIDSRFRALYVVLIIFTVIPYYLIYKSNQYSERYKRVKNSYSNL